MSFLNMRKSIFNASWLLALSALTLGADGAVIHQPKVPIVAVADSKALESFGAHTKELAVPVLAKAHDKILESLGAHTKPTLGSLKRSVFRITVYSKVWRWSRPFDDHSVVGSLGSGFLVGDSPITIATCAHVVRGADRIYLQVTEFGKTKFEAQVETINNDADVAILTLKNPEQLIAKLAEAKMKLVPLRFASDTPTLGHKVVAPGFPLGQDTMTLSTGVIAGVDHVAFHYTNLAIQSTAIISSGNSGSPLLDETTLDVVGMNYAKNPNEAQINYVVALWRLQQVLLKHKQIHPDKGKGKTDHETYQFRLVKPGLVLTPGVNALYMLSQGKTTCNSGPLISSISPSSPFRDAEPPIPENSFLVTVDGVKLDKYGQGHKKKYVDEMVDFSDLMWMREGTGEEDIEFETCTAATGESQKHKMSMAWSKKREGSGVQYVYDARLDKLDWEIYGDLLFMPLTENHISMFHGDFHTDAMIRFLAPEARQKPKLAVMLLNSGGEAQDALGLTKGSDLEIVESINGHEVNSLEDYRRHFFPDSPKEQGSAEQPSGVKLLLSNSSSVAGTHQAVRDGEELVWSLKTSAGKEFASLFVEALKKQDVSVKRGLKYLFTPAAKAAMDKLGFFAGSKKKSLLAQSQDITATEPNMDDGAETRMAGEPLEFIRREGSVGILDFAKNEGFDYW